MLVKYNESHKPYLQTIVKFIKNYSIKDSIFKFRYNDIEYFVSRNKKRNSIDCIVYKNSLPSIGFYTGKCVTKNWYYGTLNQYYEYYLNNTITKQCILKIFFDIKLYVLTNNVLTIYSEKTKSLYAHIKTNNKLQRKLVKLYLDNKNTEQKYFNYDITTVLGDRYIFYAEHFRKIVGIHIDNNNNIIASKSNNYIVNDDKFSINNFTIEELYANMTNKLALPRFNNKTQKGILYEIKNF